MSRLSSIDAVWMNMEGDGPPIAIGGLAVMAGPAPTLAEYRDFVASRVSSRMRERLEPGTLRVRQPTWVAAEPDLERQVRELVVPAPGGAAEVHAAVGRIMEIQLDPELPLWDSTLITGLADGAWGAVTRLHHTVADGQGSLTITGRLIDVDPEGRTSLAAAMDHMVSEQLARQGAIGDESPPSTAARLAEATQKGGDLILRALRTLTSVSATGSAVGAATGAAARTVDAIGSAMPGRPGPLAGDPGMDRAWTTTAVSMADVRTVRGGLGGTLNDVVMALMSGGFARALTQLGLQAKAVRVMVPLSLRSPSDLTANNQVSALLVELPVDGSAAARLADIKEHIDSVKNLGAGPIGAQTQNLVDHTVPAFVQTFAVSTFSGRFGAAFIETLVTNVPGPQFPLYVAGREVTLLSPIIPLAEPVRLNTGIMSYNGVLHFGISGGGEARAAVPEVAAGIQETLAELLEAAAGQA